MNIVLFGPAGSGKGTQAKIIEEKFGIPQISTGDILRAEIAKGSEIGKLAKSLVDAGKLVSDDVMVEIIRNRVQEKDCDNGFILDGYPRNLIQAEKLEEMLEEIDKNIDIVFEIEVDRETIIKRITGRYSCKHCGYIYNKYFSPTKVEGVCDKCVGVDFLYRSDDSDLESINKRLDLYESNTKEAVEFYAKKDLIYRIDGLESVEAITKKIEKALNSLKG